MRFLILIVALLIALPAQAYTFVYRSPWSYMSWDGRCGFRKYYRAGIQYRWCLAGSRRHRHR